MSARRFWSMEKQISRIEAERDLRNLQIASAQNVKNGEGVESLNKHLSNIIGEKYRMKREIMVAPKEGHRDKMKQLMKQQMSGLK